MQVQQMRYFVAAAEMQSFSLAARREYVSQSALSRQIALLERDAGVLLFDRSRQRVRLTDAGRFLLTRFRQVLCDIDTSLQMLREMHGKARRTVRLGFISPFLDDLVTPAILAWKKRSPGSRVCLYELTPRAQLERLEADEIDVAILGNLTGRHREMFHVQRLSRHRMAVALPLHHAAARRRRIDLSDLGQEDWLTLAEAFFPGRTDFLRATCADAGFEPRIVHEVDSVPLMLAGVAAGEGVAMIPHHAAKLPHPGCRFVRLTPPEPAVELVLVTRKRPAPPWLVGLTETLTEVARSLAD